MGWDQIIIIIAQYGLPLAEQLFQKWSKGEPPTQADFDQLRAMASQTAKDRLKLKLVAAGITLDSPEAIALLNLV